MPVKTQTAAQTSVRYTTGAHGSSPAADQAQSVSHSRAQSRSKRQVVSPQAVTHFPQAKKGGGKGNPNLHRPQPAPAERPGTEAASQRGRPRTPSGPTPRQASTNGPHRGEKEKKRAT
ncbi:hypothetical protein NDU88_000668 [Pleurodeles waltl]|uniref:Uncharacterized protein n=1 Tax=Pleurodeles waltl TaxID=8319 RepID=A0AAV7KQ07_PLEWA|nr:hypothetical protein NDU88_000668 [Pleurodeles waltl]